MPEVQRTAELHLSGRWLSGTPIIRTLVIRNSNYPDAVIRNSNYPDRLVPSGKSVENSTELTYLEIAGYRIKCSTVLWLLEL